MLSRLLCFVGATLIVASSFASPNARASVRLASGWEAVVAPHGLVAPPVAGWRPVPVPGFFSLVPRGGSNDVWYRRPITVMPEWTGRRVFLDLRSARYAPRVYVDGRPVGDRFDGWSPFEVELTASCRPGEKHVLTVRCQDYGATFPPGFVWPADQGDNAIQGKVLGLIGGYKDLTGLVHPAYLRSAPSVRLDTDLRIVTSVRRGELSVAGGLDRPVAKGVVSAEVWDAGRLVLSLPKALVTVSGLWKTQVRFPKPRYWSPEDPHRYELRLTLRSSGTVVDRVSQKFGFRELWAVGPDFVLNGVKRHLFASASWPTQEWLDPQTVRRRVKAAKAQGIDTYRLHIGPWQEEFAEAADELGLMLVTETAAYTDSGSYAYRQPLFWQNYRDHIEGMIRRDRNHPSIIMWSLGNEILSMGNERYDPDLPRKLGALAPFARSLDSTRLVTFESDLDPGNAYDVIGLHYPHELPNEYAYPETGDWLGSRKVTEAGGGMLGQKRSSFLWERRKPLYIGEYLWVPMGDYSPGTVYFGDEAYFNRADQNRRAKAQAWVDQTIAYRRSGVSALCPWTPFGPGMDVGTPEEMAAQRIYTRRQAAFLRDRGLRFFTGERARLRFDVFNDTTKPARMELQLVKGAGVVSREAAVLEPAGYREMQVAFKALGSTHALTYRLLADGRAVDGGTLPITVAPRTSATKARVVVYDPAGKWPNSVETLDAVEPGKQLLVIAQGALGRAEIRREKIPVIGGSTFDGGAFRRFVAAGGRCLVLEQPTLTPLGLGVELVEHPSTMTFALDPKHPILAHLSPEDLEHWRGDGYVTQFEIRRAGALGLRAVTVSGGPESLAQAPIAEMAYGKGHLVFVQCRVGEKRSVDPAAQRLFENAVEYLAEVTPARKGPILAVGTSERLLRELQGIGLSPRVSPGALAPGDVVGASAILLEGGAVSVTGSQKGIARALELGIPVYWHVPTPEAFRALRDVLGQPGLDATADSSGPTLNLREHALLRGVSREDLVFTTRPAGWDHLISPRAAVARVRFTSSELALAASSPTSPLETVRKVAATEMRLDRGRLVDSERGVVAFFGRQGSASVGISGTEGGYRTLGFSAKGAAAFGEAPVVEVRVDGRSVAWLDVPDRWTERSVPVYVPAGVHQVSLAFVNGGEWGGPRNLWLERMAIDRPSGYPRGVDLLAAPGSVLSWKTGSGTVVVDGIAWEDDPEDAIRGRRYLSALLGNLGIPFEAKARENGDPIAVSSFTAMGGRYNTVDAARIELRSSGTADAEFLCASEGEYSLKVLASSTPCEGVYARLKVLIDGSEWGETEIASPNDATFAYGPRKIAKGKHRLQLLFDNDASTNTEDRNLTVRQVAFSRGP